MYTDCSKASKSRQSEWSRKTFKPSLDFIHLTFDLALALGLLLVSTSSLTTPRLASLICSESLSLLLLPKVPSSPLHDDRIASTSRESIELLTL